MAYVRLTPKQKEKLLQVSAWGHLFQVYSSYGFLLDCGLVRKATTAELVAHYNDLMRELNSTADQLVQAATNRDYETAKGLADHAQCLSIELRARLEDQDLLVALSDLGLALVAKYRQQAQQEQEQWEQEQVRL